MVGTPVHGKLDGAFSNSKTCNGKQSLYTNFYSNAWSVAARCLFAGRQT
jgi:hypothetical protein